MGYDISKAYYNPIVRKRLLRCYPYGKNMKEGKTPEAQWVREMDKFECLLQAYEYEQWTYGEKNLEEFQGQVAKIHSWEGKRWVEVYQRERNAHLARRKHRIPITFLTGLFSPRQTNVLNKCLLLREIGDSNATNKVSEYLSKQFAITHISVDGILHEKAKDQSYSHPKIIQLCINEQLSVPLSLLVGLLEAEIENFQQEKKTILISGFPKDREQLDEFERKVRIDFSSDYLEHACPYNRIDPKVK